MLSFQGVNRTNSGEMYVIALAEGDAIPAGAVAADGIARSPDGYLYVVFA